MQKVTKYPMIMGIAGTRISQEEERLFRDCPLLGFIIFSRNIETAQQVRDLAAHMREIVGQDALVLIDQEGGRVARLRPPEFPSFPPSAVFADIERRDGLEAACDAVYENYSKIGALLGGLGINVNCAPMVDLLFEGRHDIVGDRAFGGDPHKVARMGRAAMNAMAEHGVKSIIKHIPGHGRAMVDSHKALPRVEATLAELEASDFVPFKLLAECEMAMTAHIVYDALDADTPVTCSAKAVSYIRQEIGFEGALISDDISMHALRGPVGARAVAALDAGCDIILHCNGNMDEMREICSGVERAMEMGGLRYCG